MADESPTADWSDVDSADDPTGFESYLDRVAGAAAEIKRRSHALLDPSPDDRLLDVGCGTGDDARALAERAGAGAATGTTERVETTERAEITERAETDGRVEMGERAREITTVGVDASEAMVSTARERTADAGEASGPAFAVADGERLPFETDAFDGVRTDRVLQHLPDPRAAVAELVRVTRPGGRVVVTEPDWGSLVVTAPGTDPATADRICDPTYACARNPRVGRRLPGWLGEERVQDRVVETGTLAFTDRDSASVLALDGRVERVAADPDVDWDGERWTAALDRDDAEDAFFASLSLVTVAVTVA